jgi:hypothetical protein
MPRQGAVIAIFADHHEADAAVKKLANGGFALTNLSIVGKGYHTKEKVVGFYNTGGRIKFWGMRGAFWGGLWGLFVGGVSLTLPVIGPVLVLGYLAAVIVAAVDGALLVGGLSCLGAALYSLGTPRDSVLQYELAVKADGFLVMARGTDAELARAETILETIHPVLIDRHEGVKAPKPIEHAASAEQAEPVPA